MLAERDLLSAGDLPPEIQRARKLNAETYDRVQAQLAVLNPTRDAVRIESLLASLRELTAEREGYRRARQARVSAFRCFAVSPQ